MLKINIISVLYTNIICPKQNKLSVSLHSQSKAYRELGRLLSLCCPTALYCNEVPVQLIIIPSLEHRQVVKEVSGNAFTSFWNLAKITTMPSKSVGKTIKNILHSAQLYVRSPRRKPLITAIDHQKCIDFAREYINKPMQLCWKK